MDPQTIGLIISFTLLYISEIMPFLPTEAQGILQGIITVIASVHTKTQ